MADPADAVNRRHHLGRCGVPLGGIVYGCRERRRDRRAGHRPVGRNDLDGLAQADVLGYGSAGHQRAVLRGDHVLRCDMGSWGAVRSVCRALEWVNLDLRPLPSGTGWYPSGVSCVSAARCTVVGFGGARWQWEEWNGRAWSVEPMPTPAVSGEEGLHAVSCLSAGGCVAVGGPYAAVQSGMLVDVGHFIANPDGTIRYAVHVPGSGAVSVLETAWDDNLARAASRLRPAPHRFVVARAQAVSGGAGVVRLLVRPNARGRHLISHHAYRVTLRAWITYTPRGGRSCSIGLYGLHPGQSDRIRTRLRC